MFVWFAFGWIAVTLWLFQLPQLPSPVIFVVFLALGILAQSFNWQRLGQGLIGLALGGLALVLVERWTAPLPLTAVSDQAMIAGQLVSLVTEQSRFGRSQQQAVFAVRQLEEINGAMQVRYRLRPRYVQLSCWDCPNLRPNHIYRLQVQLQPMRGLSNPGGFDYETWVKQQNLAARARVRMDVTAWQDGQWDLGASWGWHRYRDDLAQRMRKHWGETEFAGIYSGLLLADRGAISEAQWQVMRATGTIHLMAISGLHLALVAGMGYALGAIIWWFGVRLLGWWHSWPRVWIAVPVGLVFATVYAVLAGFTLPTQRAWLMVLVVLVFLLLRRKRQPWPLLLLAAWLIVLWQPASVLAPGFWLSFLAVAIIFLWLGLPRKPRQAAAHHPIAHSLYQAWSIQWLISLGLIPGLWWFYQAFPTYSVLANLVAVPFVSFIGLPLVLLTATLAELGELLSCCNAGLGWLLRLLIRLADSLWLVLWWALETVAAWPHSEVWLPPPSLWQVVVLYSVMFLWVAGQQHAWWWRARWILTGLVLVLVTLVSGFNYKNGLIKQETLRLGEARVTILDVGQGQAVVIDTRNHRLIYDVGPRFGPHSDAGERVIVPFLKQRPVKDSQGLIISHADLDHAGGLASLRREQTFTLRLTGEPARLAEQYQQDDFALCQVGQQWIWDEVQFAILAPGHFPVLDHNDASCVLRVQAGEQVMLITGDLGRAHERALVRYHGEEGVKADILVAGHHGSRHSSDPQFLAAVSPEWIIFSAGFRNRFGMPHPDVLARTERYTQAKPLNTACSGAIEFTLNQAGLTPQLWREKTKRWYHIPCDA
ncbi:competence protein ComEC [Thiomicrospira aerophila AL3]|uniref:Competence protein ComEC n=1 Tax=Thiomicrospira aerophila AL3 TaxID=717772 RepID=W0DR70_9GAMM|nr:DNA internalization-related competence protein ComEC/Rec2 [Thiomicrospira aerophila]AHF00957.1 competence protein ComEC [Thiomicrospira aerophila AL3]